MKPKTLVLMVVAVGFGLVAAYLTSRLGANQGPPETENVWVAINKIDRTTLLNEPEKLFKQKPFLKSETPKEAVKDIGLMKGKVLLRSLPAEQFVTLEDLGTGTALKIEKGKRAYGIRVDSVKVAGGFVMPNTKVDVYATSRNEAGTVSAKKIQNNMLVLAVDTITTVEGDKTTRVPGTVTLECTDAQVKSLAEAVEKGSLSLALRPADDNTGAPTEEELVDPKAETIDVWVAKEDIQPGTELDENNLVKKAYPKNDAPKKAIKSIEQLRGKTVSQLVPAESFITEFHLKQKVEPIKPTRNRPNLHMVTIYGNKSEPTYMFFALAPDGSRLKDKNGNPYPGKPTRQELYDSLEDPEGGTEGK